MGAEITVRVFDRAAESASWGHPGGGRPIVRTVTISAVCPRCGGPRGEVRGLNTCDDGEYYYVNVWDNPCGHVDSYAAILAEARR